MKWVSMHRRCRSRAGNWLRVQVAGGSAVQRLHQERGVECGGERGGERGGACGGERCAVRGAERGAGRGTLLLRSQVAHSRAMLCGITLLFAALITAFTCIYVQTFTTQNAWGAPASEPHAATASAAATPVSYTHLTLPTTPYV